MRRPALTLALTAIALGLAGCGGGSTQTADTSTGSSVFADAGCGGCHTLAAAGSTGTAGPSLDALKPDVARVERQVRAGGNGMPAFEGRLSEDEIDAVAQYVAGSAAGSPSQGDAFTPDATTLDECADTGGDCYRQAFGNLAYRQGPKAALDRFAAAIQTNPAVERACHPIAHTIGAAGLLHFDGDVGRAFADGTATCGSGYYHGLLEWKLAGLPELAVANVARTVCSDTAIRASNFVYYQCVHGLGHGLMLYTRYDLPDALDLCHELNTSFDRISCTGGVFMENQQSSYGERSKWLKEDNLLYPCDSELVVGDDKLYCYLLVTSYILTRVGGDWQKVAEWCRKGDADYVRICFQSMGRDASGSSRQEPSGILERCRSARPDGESECLFGAVRDILNNDSSDLRGRELCESVPEQHRSYCFYGLGSIIGSVHGSAEDRQQACARLSGPRDRADCLRGAESAAR